MRGKVMELTVTALVLWDHPRLCGEKFTVTVREWRNEGSPPPMRGKAGKRFVFFRYLGITPAYAGKSPRGTPRQQISRDHPRLCGEKSLRSVLVQGTQGSPPPMRGKGTTLSPSITSIRITPAYAGKRLWSLHYTEPLQDHPRLCGEKHPELSNRRSHQGSPPPMRGKVAILVGVIAFVRITPAYAGKSRYPI